MTTTNNKKITNDKIYLKVKIKSLAEESRIIRKHEKNKSLDNHHRSGLYYHRVGIVRVEARASLLAYGLINGKTYETLEPNAKPDIYDNQKLWESIERLAFKYGKPYMSGDVSDIDKFSKHVKEWIYSAKKYLKGKKDELDKRK